MCLYFLVIDVLFFDILNVLQDKENKLLLLFYDIWTYMKETSVTMIELLFFLRVLTQLLSYIFKMNHPLEQTQNKITEWDNLCSNQLTPDYIHYKQHTYLYTLYNGNNSRNGND